MDKINACNANGKRYHLIMKTIEHPALTAHVVTPLNHDVATSVSSIAVMRSNELFGARRELIIEHAGFLYRLRITQNNKLILTK